MRRFLVKKSRRILALLMLLVMTITTIGPDVASLTGLPDLGVMEAEAAGGTNTLDGWYINVTWGTSDLDYTWDAQKSEKKQPKIRATYRIDNAARDFKAGELKFTIPGIDYAVREGSLKAQDNSAKGAADGWSYTWDEKTATYVFTNNFEVLEGHSINGGFEFMWTLNARDCKNGFTWTGAPKFATCVKDEGGAEISPQEIALPEMSYAFTSARDGYNISWKTSRLSSDKWGEVDHDNYVWWQVSTTMSSTYRARGLFRSSYALTIEDKTKTLQAGDVVIEYNSQMIQPESGSTSRQTFYLWKEDALKSYPVAYIGVKKRLDGDKIAISGHLDRLYNEESTWVKSAIDSTENVDLSTEITFNDYKFNYYGYTYGLDIAGTVYEPTPYEYRFASSRLYSGQILRTYLYGRANKSYSASTVSLDALNNEPVMTVDTGAVEDVTDEELSENVIEAQVGPTYGELYDTNEVPVIYKGTDEWRANLDAGIDTPVEEEVVDNGDAEVSADEPMTIKIPEIQTYDMVIGDDKLAITKKDGSLRDFVDKEYNIERIGVEDVGVGYQIFAATSSDAALTSYESVYTSTDGSEATVHLGDKYKAVFVRFNNIQGSFDPEVDVDIKFHFDYNDTLTDPIDTEGYFINFPYLRALYQENGVWKDDISNRTYGSGTYADYLRERDQSIFGNSVYRKGRNYYLRTPMVTLGADTRMNDFREDSDYAKTWYSILHGTGTVRADNANSLTSCSLYVQIPDGMRVDFERDNKIGGWSTHSIGVWGTGVFETGEEFDDAYSISQDNLADYVSVSEKNYNGHKFAVFDFDFSSNPIKMDEGVTINVEFPAYLHYADYVVSGESYETTTYFMIHDDGFGNSIGSMVSADIDDIDEDGNITELLARNSEMKLMPDSAMAWQESVDKYVQTGFDDGYNTESIVRAYDKDKDDSSLSDYSYRLDYVFTGGNVSNLVFYDSIEQGAIHVGSNDTSVASEWQGTLQSVDTSNLTAHGLDFKYYWSEDGTLAETSANGEGIVTAGWHEAANLNSVDKSKIKSLAIAVDTSKLNTEGQDILYVIVKMRAPELEKGKIELNTNAVNQFVVAYDGLVGSENKHTVLRSIPTTLGLRSDVNDLTIYKVDQETGAKLSNTDAKFNVYFGDTFDEAKGSKITGNNEDGVFTLDGLGRIVIRDTNVGTYWIEEIKAPAGYVRLTEPQKVVLTSGKGDGQNEFSIANHKVRGTVTLTKKDGTDENVGVLEGAKYALYTSSGSQIMTQKLSNGSYPYDADNAESNTVSKFVTDAKGQFSVSGLPWGTYYFVETEAPVGYELNDAHVTFSISQSGITEVDGVEVINVAVEAKDVQSTASIKLIKTDAVSGAFIADAQFELWRVKRGDESNDRQIKSRLTTNAVGEIVVPDLPFGEYYFKEIKAGAGYKTPEGESAKTSTVTLDKTTVGETKEIEFTNERKTGGVQLRKKDDFEQTVPGAEYALWYKADTADADAEYKQLGDVNTTSDDGTFIVSDLEWGSYYFVETKAPSGYALSDEHVEFIIDAKTVSDQVFVTARDDRAKGSVKIIKVDSDSPDTKLPGAEFELFNINGVKMQPGVDYTTDYAFTNSDDENKIITGADGTVTISGLRQNGYYMQEIKAPENYSKLTDPVRFSVTLANSVATQELTVENEKGKASITIHKVIDEVYEPFGNPTFIFTVTDKDGNVMTKPMTLSAEQTEGDITFPADAGASYTVREMKSPRYELVDTTGSSGVTVSNKTSGTVRVTMGSAEGSSNEETVTFTNNLVQEEKISDTEAVVNIAKSTAKLTGLKVEYVGPDVLSEDTVVGRTGWDADNEMYTFQDTEDVIVTAFYDDGSSVLLHEYDMSPSTVYGGMTASDTSVTIIVRYTDINDQVAQGSFQVRVELPENEKYTVKYAVQIYGIKQEVDENNEYIGLTIGPAGGYSKYDYRYEVYENGETICENPNGCFHDLSWDEIIKKANESPEDFIPCVQAGCVKMIPLNIIGKIAGKDFSNVMLDDVVGVPALFEAINSEYRKWNPNITCIRSWSNSMIRNTLNGVETENGVLTENQSLYAALPHIIKNNIIAKKVISYKIDDTNLETYGDINFEDFDVTYDKLWLPSTYEVLGSNGGSFDGIHDQEGVKSHYARLQNGSLAFYDEADQFINVWSRSVYEGYPDTILPLGEASSYIVDMYDTDNCGIAPCFCIGKTGVKKEDSYTTKYAVRIYGILQDVDKDNNCIGLTFGPAGGYDVGDRYNDPSYYAYTPDDYAHYSSFYGHTFWEPKYRSCGENVKTCIHNMTWDEIIKVAKTNPQQFEPCLKNRCTKAVPLNVTGVLAEGAINHANDFDGYDGSSVLYDSINYDYLSYNPKGIIDNNWESSMVRNTLNGSETTNGTLSINQSLYAMLPQVLQDNIVSKHVLSTTVTNDVVETDDKLWLFSSYEMYASNGYRYNSEFIDSTEGVLYQSQSILNAISTSDSTLDLITPTSAINVFYDETNGERPSLLRSIYKNHNTPFMYTNSSGYIDFLTDRYYNDTGLSPGFCIGQTNIKKQEIGDEKPVVPKEEPIQVNYAVRIYGILQDVDKDNNCIGLTFGPAGGYGDEFNYASGNIKYRSCGENVKTCIHNMTWDEIIKVAKTNPQQFEPCLKNRCTKAVQFNITGPIAGMQNCKDLLQSYDGASALSYSIASEYRRFNINTWTSCRDGGWTTSMIRNTLVGAIDDPKIVSHGGFLTEDQSLYAMLPSELQDAIVAKKTASVYSSGSKDTYPTINITYDKLWLFAISEMFKPGGYEYGGYYNYSPSIAAEGELYQSQNLLNAIGTKTANSTTINRFYKETGSAVDVTSRTLNKDEDISLMNFGGYAQYCWGALDGRAFSPGFCIGKTNIKKSSGSIY